MPVADKATSVILLVEKRIKPWNDKVHSVRFRSVRVNVHTINASDTLSQYRQW
jgi:hypothetical protein